MLSNPPLAARGLLAIALGFVGCGGTAGASGPHAPGVQSEASEFGEGDRRPVTLPVDRTGAPTFTLDGAPFCFAGANNYFLHYAPRADVLSVLDGAAELGVRVLRIWAFLDQGSPSGEVPSLHPSSTDHGVAFQYFDPRLGRPAYRDGPDGLERLDFVLAEAKKRDIRLLLVLTNNWRDFGGMDQYLAWFGLDEHHAFYTDPRVRNAYKDWMRHLVLRENTVTGIAYKDDPVIFGWELANEPRTINFEDFDRPRGWTTETVTAWADEMSRELENLDQNHLIAVGDEGFLSGSAAAYAEHGALPKSASNWVYDAPFGVDSTRLSALPAVDFGTFHLYPENYLMDAGDELPFIEAHLALSRKLDRPVLLEEYGLSVQRRDGPSGEVTRGSLERRVAYTNWNEAWLRRGGSGSLAWMLAGTDERGRKHPDHDGFTFFPRDETGALLAAFAARAGTEGACFPGEKVAAVATSQFVGVRGAFRRPSTAVRD